MSSPDLNRFEMGKELGAGPGTKVTQARDEDNDRVVALKQRFCAADDESAEEKRLERNLEASGAVIGWDHPNLVAVHEAQADFVVMERVKGLTLKELIEKQGVLPLSRVIHVVNDVAAALEFARKKDVVHGNLKLTNLFLEAPPSGRVKVADFGLLPVTQGALSRSVSPEQREGKMPDFRSDVYGLAAVTYELLTGQPPLVIATSTGPGAIVPPSEVVVSLPKAVDQVILCGLAYEPAARFLTPVAYAKALGKAAQRKAASPPVPPPMPSLSTLREETVLLPPDDPDAPQAVNQEALANAISRQETVLTPPPFADDGVSLPPPMPPPAEQPAPPSFQDEVVPPPLKESVEKKKPGIPLGMVVAGISLLAIVLATGAWFLFLRESKPKEILPEPLPFVMEEAVDQEETPEITEEGVMPLLLPWWNEDPNLWTLSSHPPSILVQETSQVAIPLRPPIVEAEQPKKVETRPKPKERKPKPKPKKIKPKPKVEEKPKQPAAGKPAAPFANATSHSVQLDYVFAKEPDLDQVDALAVSSKTLFASDSKKKAIMLFDLSSGEKRSEISLSEKPSGICLDAHGRVLVAIPDENQIARFLPDGKPDLDMGGTGAISPGFKKCRDVLVLQEVIWVADTGHDRIVKTTQNGQILGEIPNLKSVSALASDRRGSVLACLSGDDCVVSLSADGREQWRLGEKGKGEGQFNGPEGLLIIDGTLIVADTGNHRIQFFDLASRQFKASIGKKGKFPGNFRKPRGLAYWNGRLFVSCRNSMIQVFRED